MEKPSNVFINNTKVTEQYCFVIDNRMYYKFNGKYALYELAVINEKREYAQRLGNIVEHKQVHGFFTGSCPDCNCSIQGSPVIKQKGFVCYCENCNQAVIPSQITPLVNIFDLKSTRKIEQMSCVDYYEVDLSEEDEPKAPELEVELIEED
jgi:hypothetical protein